MEITFNDIAEAHNLSIDDRFVAYQIIRHLELQDPNEVKAAISTDAYEVYLINTLNGRIEALEQCISKDISDQASDNNTKVNTRINTNSITKEELYIKREYIRMLKKCLDDDSERIKLICKCIKEYLSGTE